MRFFVLMQYEVSCFLLQIDAEKYFKDIYVKIKKIAVEQVPPDCRLQLRRVNMPSSHFNNLLQR